jgi:HPt (histidine-containing phosphotransfer) domain-containing protein
MSRPTTDRCSGTETHPAPVLDAAALTALRELDPTGKNRLLERVFVAFQTSTARLIPQLLESQRIADLQGIRHVAHTLKSSSASVGGMKLSGICADLEACIRLGQAGDLQPQVQALAEEAQSLLLALKRLSEAGR